MTNEKIGVLKRVAPSTGGLVFEDEPDVWYSATKTATQYVKADLKGKKVTIRLADKPHTFSFISLSSDQPEKAHEEQGVKEETKSPTAKLSPKVVNIKGKDFVTYAGLLEKAHEKGLKSFEILKHWQSEDLKTAWCKVRAHCIIKDKDCYFDGIGSSTPKNTGDMTQSYPIEMAHTRAKGRALRDFLNIGESMLEELKLNKSK